MARKFGQILKEVRRSKNVSQRKLAELAGVDFTYVSKLENGRLPPPAADTIVKMAEALSVAPDTLLSITGKVPSHLKRMIGDSPAALELLRIAHEMAITEEEWKSLTKKLKRLRKG